MAPVFEYEAKNKKGEKLKGTLEVDESSQVVKQLREKGYYVTSINTKIEKKDVREYISVNKKVKISDLTTFSQQFAAMIDAGISLVESLEILREQIEHPRLLEVIVEIQKDVETGSGLSEAMARYPKVFPELYCQMVKAGETGGILDQVLNELAEYYERQAEINGKIRSALYYPVAISLVAVAVVIFLLTSIVPQFVSIFSTLGGKLPLPTRILLVLSSIIQNYWWLLLAFVLGIILILYRYKKTPRGELIFDRLTLKVPLFGQMMQKIIISRMANTLSILLESGVDLLSALTVTEDLIGNRVYASIITKARGQVREGVTLSQSLSGEKAFPRMVVQMIRVGEESGSLEKMLQKISDFYKREVAASVEGTISMIEPIMMVCLALVVGFIVISIVMPMFEMFQYF